MTRFRAAVDEISPTLLFLALVCFAVVLIELRKSVGGGVCAMTTVCDDSDDIAVDIRCAWPLLFVLRSPDPDHVPHLVKDNSIERVDFLEAADVVEVEGHGARVADPFALFPDARRPGVTENSVYAVDEVQGCSDAEHAGAVTQRAGPGAGYVGDDFSPPEDTTTGWGCMTPADTRYRRLIVESGGASARVVDLASQSQRRQDVVRHLLCHRQADPLDAPPTNPQAW